jgi:hypothetical protein
MGARFVWLEKDRILFETNHTRKETVHEWQKAICEHLGGIGTTIALLMFLLFEDNSDLLLQVNSCHVIALVEEKLPSKKSLLVSQLPPPNNSTQCQENLASKETRRIDHSVSGPMFLSIAATSDFPFAGADFDVKPFWKSIPRYPYHIEKYDYTPFQDLVDSVGRYTAILLASLKTPKPIKKLMLGPPLIDCFAQLVLNPRYPDWGVHYGSVY